MDNEVTKYEPEDNGNGAELTANFRTGIASSLPIKLFAFTVFFTVVVLGGLAWYTWHSYQDFKTAQEKHLRIVELSGNIIHFNEVLTMSARMAAATGDMKWKIRYRSFKPQSKVAIKEATSLVPNTILSAAITQSSVANIRLIAMEEQAFDLVHQKKTDAAEDLLHSEEYENQKRIYSTGMVKFNAALPRLVQAELAKHYRTALSAIAVIVIIMPLVVFVWIDVMRAFKTYFDERQKAEKALQESERRYRRIFNSVSDALCILDSAGNILEANPRMCEAHGYSYEGLIGSNAKKLVHPDSIGLFEKFKESSKNNETFHVEAKDICKDGTVIDIEVNGTPINYKDEKCSLALIRDITVRKQAEQQQAELLEKVEKINGELKDFAYVVSHDLKAPLRGIGTIAGWLSADYADKLGDEGKEQMDLLLSRVKRMHNLIEGVLLYSRAGSKPEEQVRIDLNKIVTEVVEMIVPPDNIEITVENQLPVIFAGYTRVTQLFQNMLSNAIKFMDKPDGQVKINCVEEDGFWKFSVTDNGPGIKEEYFERIFKMFQTLKSRDEFESTGAGLTVAKKITEYYGGKIWVASEVGEGSTFYFTLPKQHSDVVDEAELQADVTC